MSAPNAAPNAALAYMVLDHIDAHPEQWDQATWLRQEPECGTVGCFAGWTVLLAGHKVQFDASIVGYGAIDGDEDTLISDTAAHDLGIENVRVGCTACSTCGETERASRALFSQYNSREKLGRLVAEIFGPRPGGEGGSSEATS